TARSLPAPGRASRLSQHRRRDYGSSRSPGHCYWPVAGPVHVRADTGTDGSRRSGGHHGLPRRAARRSRIAVATVLGEDHRCGGRLLRQRRERTGQRRQRIIGALSEMFGVARGKNNTTSSSEIIPWLSLLSRNAFGNYRTLLREITLDASMGKYLDLVNSGATGGAPNENYPRELMELFSLGVHVLNADGSPQVDGSGVPVPASQADVQNLARGLSGWTYGSAAGLAPTKTGNQKYYPGPMIPFIGKHDTSPKTLLGHALPANQTAEQDLDGALDIIFHHPNVGPFVATRLIRALVTSNPSADYITRVAGVFNGS